MERRFILAMVKPMSTNNGFTMIETIFVLSILCILSLLTMNLHIPSKNDEMMIQEISSFFHQAKMTAMIYKETVQVSMNHHQLSYTCTSTNKTFQLNDDSYFEDYQLTYNEFGHIKTAKTLHYHLHQKDYQFVFQVGSGCFYVR